MVRGAGALLAASAVLGLSAGGDGGGSAEGPGAPGEFAPATFTRVIEPVVPCTYDYEPMSGPREIASNSELMVQGTIGHPRAGLAAVRKDGRRGRVYTDIVPIKADSVLVVGPGRNKSVLSRLTKKRAFNIEITCAFSPPDRKAKLESLAGREALAYVVRANGPRGPGRVTYGPAGRPRPLFRMSSVEGFLMELASGTDVRDLELDQRYPADLDQFLPGEQRFPPRR